MTSAEIMGSKILFRAYWASLAILLIVLPVAHTTALRYVALLSLVLVTGLAAYQLRKIPVVPFWKVWVAYFLIGLLATVFAINPSESLSELRTEVVYSAIIFIIGVFWGGLQRKFVPLVVLLASINAILTLLAFYLMEISSPSVEIRRLPPLAYAGLDGNWLLIAMLLYLWLAIRLASVQQRYFSAMVFVALLILDCWAMLVTYNRQNFVALWAGIATFGILLLWYRYSFKRLLSLVLVMCIVTGLGYFQLARRTVSPTTAPADPAEVVVSNVNQDVRWDLWRFSLAKIAENPIKGGGLGRSVFDKLYPDYRPKIGELWHAHNMIINKGIQMGVLGMLAFLALWVALGKELLEHYRRGGPESILAAAGLAGLTAIFMKNQTDDFFVRNVALFFWLVMGLLIGHLRLAQFQE